MYNPISLPDIIGLSETWLLNPISQGPRYFRDYKFITVEAKKGDPSVPGHASGGLALFYHHSLQAEVLFTSDSWIFARFHRIGSSDSPSNFFVGLIYFKPSLGQVLGPILQELQLVLDEVSEIRLNDPLILAGDLNATIGDDCSYLGELLEGTVATPTRSLTAAELRRGSNRRGYDISDLMNSNGLLLLNGRTPGDSPAKLTYLGARGRSTIDFSFFDLVNLHLVHDFFVEQSILPSDHFPITIDLFGPFLNPPTPHALIPKAPRSRSTPALSRTQLN